MIKFATILIAAAAFSSPAVAQNSNITLRVDSGSIMTSNGGEYASANTGAPLTVGEKVMVNAGSSATLIYDSGCSVSYNAPGVYNVPSECHKAAWASTGHSNGMNAAIIAGTALVGAVIINSMKDAPVGPLSTGVRHF
jgi:hypothetical protein